MKTYRRRGGSFVAKYVSERTYLDAAKWVGESTPVYGYKEATPAIGGPVAVRHWTFLLEQHLRRKGPFYLVRGEGHIRWMSPSEFRSEFEPTP